ncbi:uncharacterized protein BP5553_02696 [Venustampulla echinocandica]|uniref:Partial AB-hydrolase lipase domain-containing protein n=1 Tax=Venustampulla echinocandica TaxID=2656787 RepID=A0A370TS51_9HELO|nr:uncharacterized protein BP5553_02696 [Venustampulla echinocandica]RDL38356.1 hypothetical protein BP5553_02696 [Venustampulla echinocandica]
MSSGGPLVALPPVASRRGGQGFVVESSIPTRNPASEKCVDASSTPTPSLSHPGNEIPPEEEKKALWLSAPSSHLFLPQTSYGNSPAAKLKVFVIRTSSLGLSSLYIVVTSFMATINTVAGLFKYSLRRLILQNPDADRPFYDEEKRRRKRRIEEEHTWKRMGKDDVENQAGLEFPPTEGGPDPVVNDAGYYARRVGLDVECFKVQTEDGYILELWHVYNPREYEPMTEDQRGPRGPGVFTSAGPSRPLDASQKPKFPILMLHGLMQSIGTFCSNDDDSLAFYLCKAGYDVWLGNNRCGSGAEHISLKASDPRLWAWSPREMGVYDLPAFTSRVLSETGFEKLGLVGHSQGTTQTFIALSKEQRPDLGDKFTSFCALAPAVYGGPWLDKWYLKFINRLSLPLYHMVFGVHSFIPIMMTMKGIIPGRLYGAMGYHMFNYLFSWSDRRWDRGLRNRMFQCSPVHVSAQCMHWWLGRDGFATNRCILETPEEERIADDMAAIDFSLGATNNSPPKPLSIEQTCWYDSRMPPLALWVSGADALVDGRKLVRRFKNGREPFVRVVHQKVIEEYEHLDVVWAMDVIEQVGREVRDVLWITCDVKDRVRTPRGCEEVVV